MKNSKLFKSFCCSIFSLLLFFVFTLNIFPQEIPNGDGDLLWEKDIYPRFVNDAKFHPINGNIIAAVNHEIWEIDPKDGHTIRVFEGGPASGQDDQFEGIQITSDGKTIVTDGGSGIEGLLIWDYETGKIKKVFDKGGPNRGSLGIYPDNQRAVFFTFKLDGFADRQIVIFNFETDQIEKQITIAPTAAQKLSLSKDGRNLAIGRTYNDNGDWQYTMELWDAETLMKIRDFGEAETKEFWDVQISNNNQFICFLGNGGKKSLYLFNMLGEEIGLSGMKNFNNFMFSNDSRKLIIEGEDSFGNWVVNFYDFYTNKFVYQYSRPALNIASNNTNEIFCGESILKYYNNNWYTVGVKPNFESKVQVNYINEQIVFTFEDHVLLKSFYIADSLGKRLYEQSKIDIFQNGTYKKTIVLKSGLYFVTMTFDNGQEHTLKLIVTK